MTPADLSELLHATATTVLTERGLDASVLPERVIVERPRNPEHGDYATNVALQLAKQTGSSPRELAGVIAEQLEQAESVWMELLD